MAKLMRGLYEQIIDEGMAADLAGLGEGLSADREDLRKAEAGDRLAMHMARLVERAVDKLVEREGVERGLRLARALVATLVKELGDEDMQRHAPVLEKSVLRAVLGRRPDGALEKLVAPLIPLLDTTLLTNAPGEPRVGRQIETEIETALRIDLVMAFIRRSGLRPLMKTLRRHCDRRRALRVLTTTYTGSTEGRALDELQQLGAEVRVSYDTSTTRLHAKAWLFHRGAGLSTAYIGSSNLTYSAQQTGLEWNVRASGARNRDVIDKVAAVFETYWQSGDFLPYVAAEFEKHSRRDESRATTFLPSVEIRLDPFQERMLEEIEVARERGHRRNLLVAATGTGKTVMAAVDYARLCERPGRNRLLFVAHREEILKQSLATFRLALRKGDFGELWVRGQSPKDWEHVFASIQSLSHATLEDLAPDHFDVVVVDEFHHAAAPSYTKLLEHIQPRELLGLTATPERTDNLDILHWFDGKIAAELRLWDAIDQQRLVPFEYYGLHDNSDLREVPWKRGRGYDVEGLTGVYTANDVWARLVLSSLLERVDDIAAAHVLGFCVSVEHARFMARVFRERGVAATAVCGDTPQDERREALRQLESGEINVLFSVDLFNEGVDLPRVDTLLLLRPTESATLFLQQLGRGLRKPRSPREAQNKTSCLVLDFVGQHRREFRFDLRLQALLGGSRKRIERQVEQGFPFLPAGCHMELEPKAREIVLKSIRQAVPSRWQMKADELRRLAREGRGALRDYLEDAGLEIEDVYAGTKSWSDLQEAAGVAVLASGPDEAKLRRACGRMLHVDDVERLEAYRDLLQQDTPPVFAEPGSRRARLARMLAASVGDQAASKGESLHAGLERLWRHPQVRAELIELFALLAERIDHRHFALDAERHPKVPLAVHARYSRIEILAAFRPHDAARVPAWQTGAYQAWDEHADLLAFTLDKTSGQFSPTTRYRDYAISPTLIHWESQGVVRAASETGRRYQRHAEMGHSIMLFARETVKERAFWFLGPATYVSHEGELPMAITWKLEHALPGDLFASFAAAIA